MSHTTAGGTTAGTGAGGGALDAARDMKKSSSSFRSQDRMERITLKLRF